MPSQSASGSESKQDGKGLLINTSPSFFDEKDDLDEERVAIGIIEHIEPPTPSGKFQYYGQKPILTRKSATGQVSIRWELQPRTVLIVKKHHDDEITSAMEKIANWLTEEYGIRIMVENAVHEAEFPQFEAIQDIEPGKGIDFCICLGGDGTLLHLNTLFQHHPIPPVASFAFGSLGFLTPFEFIDHKKILQCIVTSVEKPIDITLRMRITATVYREGEKQFHKQYTVLNEVLVDRGNQPFLSKLELFIDKHQVTTVQADGLIISTPTGSTAYSMSAGGSMVAPTVPAILLTPICPHSLSFRPIIIPDSSKITIVLAQDARSNANISFDGRNAVKLNIGDSVVLRASHSPLPSIKMEPNDIEWFNSIRSKLHWNAREEQKPFKQAHVDTHGPKSTM